jgi:hypothetical protein
MTPRQTIGPVNRFAIGTENPMDACNQSVLQRKVRFNVLTKKKGLRIFCKADS